MKAKQLYDVCEMHTFTFTSIPYNVTRKLNRFVSILYTNIPYALAKFKKRVAEQDKKYPKGAFFKIVKNGESPIKIKK